MSYDWGPHYLVPTEVITTYYGTVKLRETYDEALVFKELESLGISGYVERVWNPWYFRKKNSNNWIKIGESEDRSENFSVVWDTRDLENGQYEVMGLMHVFTKEGKEEIAIARQNVVEVTVQN
jgi:hypothetical protein